MGLRYPIETSRLALTPFTSDDGDTLYLMESDPAVKRFTGGTLTRAETAQLLQGFINQVAATGLGAVAIKTKTRGDLIGLCGLIVEENVGEIFFGLARHAWGQGFGGEACQGLIQAGFQQLALPRIIATVDPANARSVRLLERLGLRLVHGPTDAENADELVYELVAPASAIISRPQ